MRVKQILSDKGIDVHSVPQAASVLEATQLMNDCGIGAVVVTDHDRVVGIFTERDVLRRIVAEQRKPADVLVADVMTTEVTCCTPETSLDEAKGVMMRRRIRHLPVIRDDGELCGLISIGDLNAVHASDQESTIYFLHEYLYGRV